jgi:hypothetical protein
MDEYILCYVDGNWAFFTDGPLSEVSGDDWNDAPYEHNAGWPHAKEPHKIERVAFSGDFFTPCDGVFNSSYSVDAINAGGAAWLKTPEYSKRQVFIFAGATFKDFCKKVQSCGGTVYRAIAAQPQQPEGE